MKIVVLDGHALNPGDLTWEGLTDIGDCTIHARTPEREIIARAHDAEIVMTNKTPLSRETIGALPNLRYIGVLATGYNVVDTEEAHRRGIIVTNVPSYGTMSVAQLVFAHLFNLTHHIGHHTEAVRQGRWSSSADYSFWDFPLIELSGRTMGIVGLGRIGTATAGGARAFGMEVIAASGVTNSKGPEWVRRLPLQEVFRQSDVLSLHCPLTPATRELVGKQQLALMKPSAYLINTSRGLLIDEHALAEALNGGRIAGAGLDVLSTEPPSPDNPLLHAKNCFITPHIAWATTAARARLMNDVVENVRAFLRGEARNII